MILACHNLNKSFGDHLIVRDGSFHVEDREKAALVGVNGAGKSTIFKMIVGELPLDEGDVILTKGKTLGYLAQHQNLDTTNTIYEELKIAKSDIIALEAQIRAIELELKSLSGEELTNRLNTYNRLMSEFESKNGYAYESEITGVLKGLGFTEEEFSKPTDTLSGGQKTRVSLGKLLLTKPDILLLDEPTANLDPEGVVEVHDAVKKVIEATGQTMVVVEHHIDVWLDLVDRVIVLGRPDASSPTGAVIADGKPDEVFAEMGDVLAAGGAWVPGRAIPDYSPKQESAHDAPVLSTENLSFGRGAALGVGINLDFYPGEVTALMGPNGAGKSTLALTLAGLLKPIAGKVLIADNLKPAHAGREPIDWKSKELLGRIGMVFQEPEHQFAANFVRDEVSIGPKSMGQSQDEAYQTADRMLEQMNLTRFAKANPYTLSGGEKRRLSVASMLAAAPKVLVMDEPTFGQDFSTWNEMVKLIAAIRDQGSCVIMVTHDEALVDALGARRVMFEEAKA